VEKTGYKYISGKCTTFLVTKTHLSSAHFTAIFSLFNLKDFKSKGNYRTDLLSIMNNMKENNTRDHQVAASGDNEVSVQAGKEITASSDDPVGSSVGDVVAMPHHSLASYDRNDSLSPVVILHTYSILDEDDNDDHNQFSFPSNSDADAYSSLNEDPHFINEPVNSFNSFSLFFL